MSESDAEEKPAHSGGGGDTVARIDLAMHDLTVSVSGQADDDLDAVRETAEDLMGYLIERSDDLEDEPGEYGLSD